MKVFGYPVFDENGEKILTQYDGEYSIMNMDIRVYRMKANETKTFNRIGEEIAVLLLKGKVKFKWDGQNKTVSRKSVFTEGPWAVHVSSSKEISITAETDGTEILVQCTHNETDFDSKIYGPKDAPWGYSCQDSFGGGAARRVNTIFDYSTEPYSNMVLGEVINDRGNWSGYIPHHHPQPECYYFIFDRPEGFGASFIGDQVFKSTDGSFSAITPDELHPQVCAPGYQMYTCWMIRHNDGDPWKATRIDDERYTWLYNTDFNEE